MIHGLLGPLGKKIRAIIRGEKGPLPPDPQALEELRLAFKTRYHHFKLLLNANNRALETMTEMESALRGKRPFSMTFVRSRTTMVTTNVFQMIQHLDTIAPEKYRALFDKFKDIKEALNNVLESHAHPQKGPLVVRLREVGKGHSDLVGAKMANLGELTRIRGVNVPPGFVITAPAYWHFIQYNGLLEEIRRRLQKAELENLGSLFNLSSEVQQLILLSKVPEELRAQVEEILRSVQWKNRDRLRLAVRSSGIGEDLKDISYAGQYRSELNVSPEDLLDAYKEVISSKYGLTAMAYRFNKGIPDEDVAMCVGVIEMIEAKASGVMYTRDPILPDGDEIIINSTWGLPKAVVDGSVSPDVFRIGRTTGLQLREKLIHPKNTRYTCLPEEGVCREELVEKEAMLPSLTDEMALRIAAIALQIEAHFQEPQDIEWLVDKEDRVWILQSRPLKIRELPRSPLVSDNSPREEGLQEGQVILKGGITASPGAASGPVFIVKQDADTLRFPVGAILVAAQALPRWAPLLSRAKGLITELGSITGHLANVAREFKVPAIFGLPSATKELENGMWITMYADAGLVVRGKTQVLETKEEECPIKDSPVYQTLLQVSMHIVPLTLLDPDSPSFRPSNVKTLHDITRFCHEKAVYEMFNFGKIHRFPERSSKQLLCDVPMQFWVIDLDDAFTTETEGPYIRIQEISSVPMLALWEGMVKIPWKGPPAVHAKGFMSVLMEATQNPDLEPGRDSQLAAKNYFMVSRNYCSLQSRFGFHFSTVEALVGERPQENYISFQFKGGAANLKRRITRAQLVGRILGGLGFRTEVREDSLFARIEGYERGPMEQKLKALGYLIIHTRQLDMVMDDPATVTQFEGRFKRELFEGFQIQIEA